ncbi:MAG: ParM/StbA family protein, partial [Gemmatimonadota bacterium]|nr:ParM/StbA family protein [Gemmatimonadota bacterium]
SIATLSGQMAWEFNVVTGLPIRYFKQYRSSYVSMLEGEHRVAINDRGESREKILSIKKVRVLPQPFGAVFNLLMNNHGRIVNRDIARDKFGVIDIGFRTTDYTITDRLRYIERGSRTTDSGIAKAFSLISRKILEQSGISVELYRLFDPVKQGRIRIRGKDYSLTELRAEVLKQLANSIVSDLERLWIDDWDLEFVMLTGGGSADLAPILEKMIQGPVKLVNAETDMRLANVEGYLKYARYIDMMEKHRGGMDETGEMETQTGDAGEDASGDGTDEEGAYSADNGMDEKETYSADNGMDEKGTYSVDNGAAENDL